MLAPDWTKTGSTKFGGKQIQEDIWILPFIYIGKKQTTSHLSNLLISNLEKFSIGLINSLFLFIPTSAAHIITIRRFLMQGLEAGYLSGLGSIAGNILWIASILFGWRFIVIPWISLDIFRYLLGFKSFILQEI